MKEERYQFTFQVYDSIHELKPDDAWLLREAQNVTNLAYAPYSKFRVGAVARLSNGEIVSGSNQENASFPAGLCAERVLLSSVSSLYPKVAVESIAISYNSETTVSNHPIAPCGICRQSLQEYESRMRQPIRLILGGLEGKVYVVPQSTFLLPFSFTENDLK